MKKLLFLFFFGKCFTLAAQAPLHIPDTLSGSSIDLYMADSSHQFYAGYTTTTIGYNGAYLGPTLILEQGQNVTLNVHNQLSDTTTTHWHGLHVEPMNDGGPHTPIMAGTTWSPSFTVMDKAATYWYHPHLHRKTMTQFLKGAAGLIIVQDQEEAALNLPRTYGVDDIPLVFQFQHMDNTTKQFILSDELDNTVMVNGAITAPYVDVPAQMVRLRMLNASSHRFFEFGFSDNRTFHQITSDDGLLNAPVSLTRLMLSPGERAEILVDFSGQTGTTVFMKQYGTQLPAGYPGGPPDGMGMMPMGPLDNTDFNLLQFNVIVETPTAIHTMPSSLTTNTILSSTGSGNYALRITGSPAMSMTNFLMNGVQYDMGVINFTVEQDSVMRWTITNQSMMPHPFHIHGNHFYVLTVNGATPPLNQQGRKDVITVPPMGGSVVLITKYTDFSDPMMPYMYHCHILSHEDNGMMGQFIVSPRSTNVPSLQSDPVAIYPNPVQNQLTVDQGSSLLYTSVDIVDATGKCVFSKTALNTLEQLNVSELAKGMYVIRLSGQNGKLEKHFLKN